MVQRQDTSGEGRVILICRVKKNTWFEREGWYILLHKRRIYDWRGERGETKKYTIVGQNKLLEGRIWKL